MLAALTVLRIRMRDFSLPFVTCRVITSAKTLYHPSHLAYNTLESICAPTHGDRVFTYSGHMLRYFAVFECRVLEIEL